MKSKTSAPPSPRSSSRNSKSSSNIASSSASSSAVSLGPLEFQRPLERGNSDGTRKVLPALPTSGAQSLRSMCLVLLLDALFTRKYRAKSTTLRPIHLRSTVLANGMARVGLRASCG
ncbi:hypothetical protein TRVL_03142 [Trypanosoma vivax]|nr:hypothetical protein TRVL_03142 [Trypanosoma vivax]